MLMIRLLLTTVYRCGAALAAALFMALTWPAHAQDETLRLIKIRSGDVAALAREVGTSANADTIIELESGAYHLTAPLRLQRNQFLRGNNRYLFQYGTPAPGAGGGYADPGSETVVDCASIVGAGCVFISDGGVVNLTISGGVSGALVQIGGAGSTPPFNVLVRRADLRGAERALRVQVTGASQAATVTVEQSVLRDTVGFFQFGWQVQAGGGGGSIDFSISNSTITGNLYGGFVAGLGNNAALTVTSHANRYIDNGAGLLLNAGRDATAALGVPSPGANGNTLSFVSEADDFIGNGSHPRVYWPTVGGIVAIAALRTSPNSAPHSNNTMWLTVKDPSFENNAVADLLAHAAVSLDGGFPLGLPSAQIAGQNNRLFLELDVGSHRGAFYKCDSIPATPTAMNQVVVSGDTDAIMQNCAVQPGSP